MSIDYELVVMIEQLEHPDRMVFSSEIGAVTDDQELPVYEALLCYNLLWKDTGGVKIGLAGPKGILIVTTELLLDGLTLMFYEAADPASPTDVTATIYKISY
jgi:hypothetical protein